MRTLLACHNKLRSVDFYYIDNRFQLQVKNDHFSHLFFAVLAETFKLLICMDFSAKPAWPACRQSGTSNCHQWSASPRSG